MLPLGHLGIGGTLARYFFAMSQKKVSPLIERNTVRVLLLGCMAPDLIDKPIFYFLKAINASTQYISCTRTLGHSLIFWLFLGIGSYFLTKKRVKTPFCPLILPFLFGLISHFALDLIEDALLGVTQTSELQLPFSESSALIALFYPFYRDSFAQYPFHDLKDHLWTRLFSLSTIFEGVGLALLFRKELAISFSKKPS